MTLTSPSSMELSNQAMDKAQRKLIPFVVLMFVLSYLDRVNVGFAKQAYQISTGISDTAFALGAGIFFIGYAIFEVPSNIILHHVGTKLWMTRIMIVWGAVAVGCAWATTETSFLALRVLLGVAEAGFYPGIVYYFTLWFCERRRSTVMGLLMFGPPLAFVFGSPISGALMEMDGVLGFHGWQWLFAVEGLASVVVGIWAYWYLVDKPQDAKWLTNEEKQALSLELKAEIMKKPDGEVSPIKVLFHPEVLMLCSIYFMIQISSYGVAFSIPSQVAGLLKMKVGFIIGVVTAIPWICAVMALVAIPKYSDRSGKRGSLSAVLMLLAGLGIITSGTSSPSLGIAALCIAAACIFSTIAIFWTLPARLLSGVASASAIGFINACGNIGGFVAPNLRLWAGQTFNDCSAEPLAIGMVSILGALLFLVSIPLMAGNNANQS